MSAVFTCPDIPDDWKGTVGQTAAILGIHRVTLNRYAKLGKKSGGIDWYYSTSGRKLFTGREVKRFWHTL